jgi:hypothetical protein
MIYDSSKNYLDGWVTLVFDGADPTLFEVVDYVKRNYGFIPKSVDIESPCEGFGGYMNSGIVKAHPLEGYFE